MNSQKWGFTKNVTSTDYERPIAVEVFYFCPSPVKHNSHPPSLIADLQKQQWQ
ncbi:MAG: hypothetical protein ABIN67_24035 [Ferruginibacter sp.]